MPPANNDNPKSVWLAKVKQEAEEAARKKFEADKALKDKKPPPWSPEAWAQAAADHRAGIVRPQPRFPIVITSTGPLSTPQKVQDAADLPSVPEVKEAPLASWFEEEDPEGEKVQYCDVDIEEDRKVREYFADGEDILIWFNGKRRYAWLAHSEPKKDEAADVDTAEDATTC